MGDSQTITGLILAALAVIAALTTLVLMVLLLRAVAIEAKATLDPARTAKRHSD